MQHRTLVIKNRLGLHARAAARVVKLAHGFQSDILLARADARHKSANARSIFGLLLLAATQGTTIDVTAEGPDEIQAVESLCRLIEENFGEG
jgi:phosphocarrier protein